MKNSPVSRREFLKAAGITLGTAFLADSLAGCRPQSSRDSEEQSNGAVVDVETPAYTYGDERTATGRILVAYATRTGSTVGVAAAIGETLGGRGFLVDVKPMKENPTAIGYHQVVLGSAIHGGQWLPEAVEYAKNNEQVLKQARVALFCVHIMNLGDEETSKNNRLAYLNSVRPLLQPRDEEFFAGMGMDPDEQSPLIRWVYKTFSIGGIGDCRDWDKIRGWAAELS